MPTRPGQKRVDEMQLSPAAQRTHRTRPASSPDEALARVSLPTMQASARRCRAMRSPEAAKRKSKRPKRARSLGGRLAAAIRLTRLRASRAAEDYFRAR